LKEIETERIRQDKKWGEQNHPDGTAFPFSKETADLAKFACDKATKEGTLTWMHILEEEQAEAFAESDEDKLEVELIQTAAVAVAWVEAIRRRREKRKNGQEAQGQDSPQQA